MELTALKPGNVHIFADGHGMVVQDFVKSAEVASIPISKAGYSVGERVLNSVTETWNAVGCNTNLGIILLSAPIIEAAFKLNHLDIRKNLNQVLTELTVTDSILTYRGIRMASPAGLGESNKQDVNETPSISLLEAMKISESRDMIAKQYSNCFADVFDFGLIEYRRYLSKWNKSAWAITKLYLSYMACFPDTHVTRKLGLDRALALQEEAKIHEQVFGQLDNPKIYQSELLAWDKRLKDEGVNPGTSADLVVATLLVSNIGMLNNKNDQN